MKDVLMLKHANQELLLEKLSTDMAKCVKRYFSDGGDAGNRVDLKEVFIEALKRGAIAYSGENLELAAALLNCNSNYLKCFISLRKAKVKRVCKNFRQEKLDQNNNKLEGVA